PPDRLPEHAPGRGADGAPEVPELPRAAELLPGLPPARRRGRVEPDGRQGQRPLPPGQEHLERPSDEARQPRLRGGAEPERLRELSYRARLCRVPRRPRRGRWVRPAQERLPERVRHADAPEP